jgi:hypothetical protein
MKERSKSKTINPNEFIRDYVSNGGASDWQHKEIAKELYNAEELFRFYFFQPLDSSDYKMPQSVIGIEPMHIQTLASYHLVPNAIGLRYQITLNSLYLDRPKYSLYESLLHEMAHLYQENHPTMEKCKNGYHNLRFVGLCEELGLHPRPGSGAHWKAADGQFEKLMDRFGVRKPKEADNVVPPEAPKVNWWENGPKSKGSSTLILYMNPDCIKKPMACKIRSGRKDLDIKCNTCGGKFVPVL